MSDSLFADALPWHYLSTPVCMTAPEPDGVLASTSLYDVLDDLDDDHFRAAVQPGQRFDSPGGLMAHVRDISARRSKPGFEWTATPRVGFFLRRGLKRPVLSAGGVTLPWPLGADTVVQGRGAAVRERYERLTQARDPHPTQALGPGELDVSPFMKAVDDGVDPKPGEEHYRSEFKQAWCAGEAVAWLEARARAHGMTADLPARLTVEVVKAMPSPQTHWTVRQGALHLVLGWQRPSGVGLDRMIYQWPCGALA